ncbi:MAG: AbrB/MazE/SpoVT family DNA-binding domain-containing protein [Rhodocyclales bacterium]|nr:AbrB/MazE/SpoVT family DNA-binding domain-containing protein [Rhodocyclales bacterium]
MTQLGLIDVEGELGVILPEEILSRLRAKAGDELVLAETPAGYLLTVAKSAPEVKAPLVP